LLRPTLGTKLVPGFDCAAIGGTAGENVRSGRAGEKVNFFIILVYIRITVVIAADIKKGKAGRLPFF
jgi:hypothetical protein